MQCPVPRPSAAERLRCEASLRDEVGSPLPVPWRLLSPCVEDMFPSYRLSPNSHPNLYLPKDASTCMTASLWAPPTPSSSAELSSSACPSSAHSRPSVSRLHPPALLSTPFPRSVLQSSQFCLRLPPGSPRSHGHRLPRLPRLLESFLTWPPPWVPLQSHCPLSQAVLHLTVGEAQAAWWSGLCWEDVDDLSEGKREQCRWETAIMKCAPLLVNPGLPLNPDYRICSPSIRTRFRLPSGV